MKISPAGVELIKHFEGCELDAYRCSAGVLTIGYGHTGDVKESDKIDQAMAELMLLRDLKRFEVGVSNYLKAHVTQNQFDAFVIFSYNVGLGNFSKSTLLRLFNSGATNDEVADQFLRWTRANGKILPGLVRRREAERQMFLGLS